MKTRARWAELCEPMLSIKFDLSADECAQLPYGTFDYLNSKFRRRYPELYPELQQLPGNMDDGDHVRIIFSMNLLVLSLGSRAHECSCVGSVYCCE